jgi:hypothetical protein
MGFRWKDASILARVATGLAITGTVSLGLCGINWIFPARGQEFAVTVFGLLGFVGIVVSVLGLFVVCVAWIARLLIEKLSRGDKPIHLFENEREGISPESSEQEKDKP